MEGGRHAHWTLLPYNIKCLNLFNYILYDALASDKKLLQLENNSWSLLSALILHATQSLLVNMVVEAKKNKTECIDLDPFKNTVSADRHPVFLG
jgi:hypothetical protein